MKMAISIDYKSLEGNFGKKFGKVGARPTGQKDVKLFDTQKEALDWLTE